MKYNEVLTMHQPFEPRPPLEELLQNLASLNAADRRSTADQRLAYYRQIHAIVSYIQRSPALWQPARLPDPAYSDGLAAMYNRISEIPLVGSMDWLNAQLQVAFAINQALVQSLSTLD
jgi:hypothetical protein